MWEVFEGVNSFCSFSDLRHSKVVVRTDIHMDGRTWLCRLQMSSSRFVERELGSKNLILMMLILAA